MKKAVKSILSLILIFTFIFAMPISASAAAPASADTKAAALKSLGLFKGVSETEVNFDLNRAPTRTEALVMLIRALGKESEALNGSFSHPFTDVPSWADQYIGYAYEKGLTKGISETKLGTGNADSDMYLTFMLRALGYSDAAGDFVWDAPDALAKAVGVLPVGVDTKNFLREDVALISWAALEADMRGSGQKMAKKLIEDKVFTSDAYAQAVALAGEKTPAATSVSSLEALKTALSDSSVKAVAIDSVGTPVIVTDELTIPEGVTVTINYGSDLHIEGNLTNNGTINVMGADAIQADFINYSVLAVQKGGKFFNNGAINLLSASLSDTSDRGPVGGQLRVFDGSFVNRGSVFLKAGAVNTHGGMIAVIEGPFTNDGIVIVDGFQIAIAGSFINSKDAVVINNSYITTEMGGTFTNNGTLSGSPVAE